MSQVRRYLITCPYCREPIDYQIDEHMLGIIHTAYQLNDNWMWIPCYKCNRDFQIDVDYLKTEGKIVC